jgi:DNA-binding response OmpR family regulator
VSQARIEEQQRVHFVRWPTERGKRDHYRAQGLPTLLLVDPGAPPPVCGDPREDWVRTPVSKVDLDARISGLRARTAASHLPEIDPVGVVRFSSLSVAVSPTEADLLSALVDRIGEVVGRDSLLRCLPDRQADSRCNALNLHIMRIRRRIQPLGLTIRTVWGKGYVLEQTI